MLKRMTAAALLASLLFSQPVSASLITQVGEAEAAAGIDNSDKSLIERLKILENETGLEGNEGTLSERVAAVERELVLDSSGAAAPEALFPRYTFEQLESGIQDVYRKLYTGISQMETEFAILADDEEDVKIAAEALLMDCPEFFWFDGDAHLEGQEMQGLWSISPAYNTDAGSAGDIRSRIDERVLEFLSTVPAGVFQILRAG